MFLVVLALGCEPRTGPPPEAEPFDPFRLPPLVDPETTPGLYYRDADGDGYAGREVMMADADPDGAGREWIATKTALDCDDDPNECGAGCHPNFAGPDLCDDRDQDCDGALDEDPDRTWFVDRDGDGYGDSTTAMASCDPVDGRIELGDDCDDDPNACGAYCSPSIQEALLADNCVDGLDNDCDGHLDLDAAGCDTNRPPIARFVIDPGGGSIDQSFFFDASSTRDPEDAIGLTFSWDFDSDGVFELSRRSDSGASWTFSSEGTHPITLRVEDPKGLYDEYIAHAIVSPREQLIVVTSTADVVAEDQQTTLREAIDMANRELGPNTIVFAAPMTIALTTGALPIITDADTTMVGRPGLEILGTATAQNFCLEADSQRATILWIEIANCPDDGLEMRGNEHWVAHLWAHDNGDDGVDFSTGSGNRIGPHVVVWENGDAGFEIEGESTLIEESRSVSNGRGVQYLGRVPAHGSMLIRTTIAENNVGIQIAPQVDRIALWHNTIYGNGTDGVRYDPPAAGEASGALHDVRNNVFIRNGGWAVTTSGGFAMLSTNAFFENTSGICTGCQSEPGGIESDPALMDPVGGDFRLVPGSPCIDAGEDLGLGYKGSAPDLGAFEHEP